MKRRRPTPEAVKELSALGLSEKEIAQAGAIIPPRNRAAARSRDTFVCVGSEANTSIAEAAELERADPNLLYDIIRSLRRSLMYTRLDDEAFRAQDYDASSFLRLHARLFVAGMLAERRQLHKTAGQDQLDRKEDQR